jgi:hypothetical protein
MVLLAAVAGSAALANGIAAIRLSSVTVVKSLFFIALFSRVK